MDLMQALDPLIGLIRDVLVEPLWALTGLPKDGILGRVLERAAEFVALGLFTLAFWSWWQISRVIARANDRQTIAAAQYEAPHVVKIIIADFLGEGLFDRLLLPHRWFSKDEKIGDDLIGRMETDFVSFAPGEKVKVYRWRRYYSGKRAERRARLDANALGVDLILWGKKSLGGEVVVRLATADATREPVRLAFGQAKTYAEGTLKLTIEVGDAIAFFAAQLTKNGPVELLSTKAKDLDKMAEKLAGLINKPPKGLTKPQLKKIEQSFDPIGTAALERLFPSGDVLTALLDLRHKRAQATRLTTDWLLWGKAALSSVDDYAEMETRLGDIAKSEPDPPLRAATLVLLAQLFAQKANFARAQPAAEQVLTLQPPEPVATQAHAVLSFAFCQIAIQSDARSSVELFAKAEEHAQTAMSMCTPDDLKGWLDTHLFAAQVARFSMGSNFGRTDQDIYSDALARINKAKTPRLGLPVDCPQATVRCSIERCELLSHAEQFLPDISSDALYEDIVNAAGQAQNLISDGTSWQIKSELARTMARALLNLGIKRLLLNRGTKKENFARISASIETSRKVAKDLSDAPGQVGVLAQSQVVSGLLARSEIRFALKSNNFKEQQVELEASEKDLEEAISLLNSALMPHWGPERKTQNSAVCQYWLGRAYRLMAQLADGSAESARSYRGAADHFRVASTIYASIGTADSNHNFRQQRQSQAFSRMAEQLAQDAAACENLANGVEQARD